MEHCFKVGKLRLMPNYYVCHINFGYVLAVFVQVCARVWKGGPKKSLPTLHVK